MQQYPCDHYHLKLTVFNTRYSNRISKTNPFHRHYQVLCYLNFWLEFINFIPKNCQKQNEIRKQNETIASEKNGEKTTINCFCSLTEKKMSTQKSFGIRTFPSLFFCKENGTQWNRTEFNRTEYNLKLNDSLWMHESNEWIRMGEKRYEQ